MNEIRRDVSQSGAVAVVGGGVGGMQAALDLADAGFRVHIVQRDSAIGGTMAMLDKTFPTGDCAMCMISPRMVEAGRHPGIKLHTLSEVVSLSGVPGDFRLKIHEKPRYVDPEKCTGCGDCEQKCPGKAKSGFEQGLARRRAIYSLLPQAVPHTRVIDPEKCLRLTKGKCGNCEAVCPAGAINYNDKAKDYELRVGAVILSPGLDRYDPGVRGELGYGRWPNVVTSLQFERILSASGPFRGEIRRPSDGAHPEKIAWIQCVGSRDPHKANPWCSSVCCMYSAKQAIIVREHDAGIQPTIFYMDMRSFGKDFDKYIDRAKTEFGVNYCRAMISDVKEEAGTGRLRLRHAAPDGTLVTEVFDMVVLSVGMQPHRDVVDLAGRLGVSLTPEGFAAASDFAPVETSRPGVYAAGSFQGPKDIPATVTQGSAAAGQVLALLAGSAGTEIKVPQPPPEREVSGEEPRIGVFVCHCGVNISQTVDVKQVADRMKNEDGVAYAGDLLYACSPDGQERIQELVREKGLNRVVVASCTPRTHAPLFQDTIRDAGLNKYLFELADIREQCSWCHMGRPEEATEKAGEIVRMGVAKARLLAPIPSSSAPVTPSALVVGAGAAGMTAALALGGMGFGVHLVEREDTPGGLLRRVFRHLDGGDTQKFLQERIAAVTAHPKITLHTGCEVEKTDGFAGNFETKLTSGARFSHGAVIIASGGVEYEPAPGEYGFGDPRVITQRDLEARLAAGADLSGHTLMIQCVGGREEPDNYCSRICCQDAIKNAVALKERDPAAEVTILYRDLRTYGLREKFYRKARTLGVNFIRFDLDRKPEVETFGSSLTVRVRDEILRRDLLVHPDRVVLSTGLRPHPATRDIASKYRLNCNLDGFLLEAHVKLRPVDFPGEGIFLAGLAHAPKNLDETLDQALAAAGRAGVLLRRDRLPISPLIARHDRDLCMSCLACVRLCPFDSPFVDKDGKVSHNEVKCTGCGVCAGVCPAGAFQVNGFRDDQILAMIDALPDPAGVETPGVEAPADSVRKETA